MLNRGEHLVYNIAGKATVPEDDAQWKHVMRVL
jgi:hypothetical protein